MITILDYGMGSPYSVENALRYISCTYCITDKKEDLQRVGQLILPDVGASADCTEHLQECDLITALREEIQGEKKPLLGVCLDMQALFEDSEGSGYTKELDFLRGNIVRMSDAAENRLRIPHIGWNLLEQCQESSVFERLGERPFVYYVHSYYTQSCAREDLLADSGYGGMRIPGPVRRDNVVSAQFRPEKNGEDRLQILRWFKEESI